MKKTILLVGIAWLAAGCGEPPLPKEPPVSPGDVAKIQSNNPHLPPEARAAIKNLGKP